MLKPCWKLFSGNLFYKDLQIHLIYVPKLILLFSKDDSVAPEPVLGPVFHTQFAAGSL